MGARHSCVIHSSVVNGLRADDVNMLVQRDDDRVGKFE